MDWDHLAEEYNDKLFAGWLQLISVQSPALPSRLAAQHRRGIAWVADVLGFTTGAYNICCIFTFENGFRALVRFPFLGRSRFRTEKSRNEALAMKLLSQNTALPVPRIPGMGRWGCGPYSTIQSSSLHPNVSDSDIQSAYRVMAQVILELSKPTFSAIGALAEGSRAWKVDQSPLILNMNELRTFTTAGGYFEELARQQLLHLQYQRNDAVEDEQDCRKRYIARCLFRKIARGYKREQSGPFQLYCDDLRPSNILVAGQNLTLTGVIDWEFTYVAPAEFALTAPWWLLFECPEAWETDLNDEQIHKGAIKEYQRLSGRMSESMENGLFWFCLAARKSFMFDDIYWQLLDKRYFGQGFLEDRLSLLSEEELDELEMFVSSKMEQTRENRLDEHISIDKLIDL
ncbi:phosphotransferase enzyme family protein, partial [Aspergillus niger ATCC 13496]